MIVDEIKQISFFVLLPMRAQKKQIDGARSKSLTTSKATAKGATKTCNLLCSIAAERVEKR